LLKVEKKGRKNLHAIYRMRKYWRFFNRAVNFYWQEKSNNKKSERPAKKNIDQSSSCFFLVGNEETKTGRKEESKKGRKEIGL
jgi:hypothetical protein